MDSVPAAPQFGISLSERELLETALWLERTGAEFYRFLAEGGEEDAPLRQFFLRLAGMEMKHENHILDLLQTLAPGETFKSPFDETLTGREFFLKLRTAAEEKIFPLGFNLFTNVEAFKTPRDALPMALRAEEQAIRLYRLLAGFALPPAAKKIIEHLIEEEESHLEEVRKILRTL